MYSPIFELIWNHFSEDAILVEVHVMRRCGKYFGCMIAGSLAELVVKEKQVADLQLDQVDTIWIVMLDFFCAFI